MLHLHKLIHRHHVAIKVTHDPDRAENDEAGNENPKGEGQYVVGIVRVGGDVQEEHEVNAHLRDGKCEQREWNARPIDEMRVYRPESSAC